MGDALRMKRLPSRLNFADFMSAYGSIYEHSPHFAAAIFPRAQDGALDTLDGLTAAFREVISVSGHAAQLQLLLAHPDLAVRMGVAPLTDASANEQASAGLDQCTPGELAEFVSSNKAYRKKFGFPYIKAVRGLGRGEILEDFRRRLANDTDAEFATALEQIHKIALLRLSDLIE